jgi:hypothetical protein
LVVEVVVVVIVVVVIAFYEGYIALQLFCKYVIISIIQGSAV